MIDIMKKLLNISMHPTKTKYISVNDDSPEPFYMGNMPVNKCSSYIYLGANISADSFSDQIEADVKQKETQAFKFYSFINKNFDAPFKVKKKVWQNALMSSLMFSCESWLTNDVKSINTVYNETLKYLLRVRTNTCNDITFLETGICDAKSVIKSRQTNFFRKLYNSSHYNGSYINNIINLVKYHRTPAARYLLEIENNNENIYENFMIETKNKVLRSDTTKRVAYKNMNPELNVHPLYSCNLDEYKRIELTRLRLISHNLRIETQRWSRIEAENRLCNCGLIQNEEHVLCNCPLTQFIRNKPRYNNLNFASIENLMKSEALDLASYTYESLKLIYDINTR